MKEVQIQQEWIDSARRKAEELGSIKRSIMKGKANIYGFLGEEVISNFYGLKINNTFDNDLIIDNEWRIDVKSKHCTSKPLPHYECSLGTYYKQKCDFYIFVRILKDLSKCWVLGAISRNEYFDKAIFKKKGDYDSTNNFTFREDAWNIPINQLHDLSEVFEDIV